MDVRVSVAMAVYNGEKYLDEQIQSILPQFADNDELIISYNKSDDSTLRIINKYSELDSRVKVIECDSTGVITNFENAIVACSGKFIFLADQDDIWISNKLEIVLEYLKDTNTILIIHGLKVIDENSSIINDTYDIKFHKSGVLNNIIKNSFQGCCMAFKKELRPAILPIPSNVPMHDQWIGLLACYFGKVIFIDNELILYRRHGLNVSHKFKLRQRISNRIIISHLLYERIQFLKSNRYCI